MPFTIGAIYSNKGVRAVLLSALIQFDNDREKYGDYRFFFSNAPDSIVSSDGWVDEYGDQLIPDDYADVEIDGYKYNQAGVCVNPKKFEFKTKNFEATVSVSKTPFGYCYGIRYQDKKEMEGFAVGCSIDDLIQFRTEQDALHSGLYDILDRKPQMSEFITFIEPKGFSILHGEDILPEKARTIKPQIQLTLF